ncbi:hypothetical protein B14_00887 [Bacillus licheniformis]|jgi:flagellar basal body-associated protein FliL|nr:hypothetical protein B14_00887 [Bacillus licheniformis]MCU9961370.1 hypothetical protein [Bacillus licheniformis]OLG04090.1 hypothetical protein B4124_2010 [Bacillus licheniformis]TWJ49052.1 hypothetical protein CHCC5024_3923 [Bacillus licheniformis]TWL86064.1 hypothetical protein CHCC15311_2458 [Bacillus licheniformis]
MEMSREVVKMSPLTIVEVILALTVLGLFAWTFKSKKSSDDDDVYRYARYMIYLLVAEVAIYVIFSFI